MPAALAIADSSPWQLLDYLRRQLETFFPDGRDERPLLERHLPAALERLGRCIESVLAWTPGVFSPLQTSQYATFLYFFANTIWRAEGALPVCAKLFALNKALNGIDLFYEIEMPKVFFIGHSVGVVLAKAEYGEHLVLYQNATVGRNHGRRPSLGRGVILYPNAAIIGGCTVGNRTVLSQGASLVDQDTPGDCLVFRKDGRQALLKPSRRNYLEEYFRGM
jgi:serine O-acetyltransferase